MVTSAYKTIQPPFTLNFPEMPKKELKAYFKWFQEIVPERIEQLTLAVQSTPGFGHWRPDLSPHSLDALGDWFAGQIETRPRTAEEIAAFKAQSPYPIERSDSELTNRTFSLAVDIGMYLNQVFLKNDPSLKWDQQLKDKRFIDYGQPVLVGFRGGNFPFNSVRMLVTLAYGLRDRRHGGEELRAIYEINLKGRHGSDELRLNPRYQTKWKRSFSIEALLELITRMTVKESYKNSDDSISWHAHREAETLADSSLVDGLASYVASERDKERREAAYFILGKLGQKVRGVDCASILLSHVDKEQNKDVLSNLLDSLEDLPKPRGLDLGSVYRLLRDDRWLVRHAAIKALKRAEASEAEDHLIELLNTTNDPNDIIYCQATLNEIGSAKAIPHLQKNLDARKRDVRESAKFAIEAIKWRARRSELHELQT